MTASAKPKTLDEAALEMARVKYRLVDAEGNVRCINQCAAPATLPTLECATCLDKRLRGWR